MDLYVFSLCVLEGSLAHTPRARSHALCDGQSSPPSPTKTNLADRRGHRPWPGGAHAGAAGAGRAARVHRRPGGARRARSPCWLPVKPPIFRTPAPERAAFSTSPPPPSPQPSGSRRLLDISFDDWLRVYDNPGAGGAAAAAPALEVAHDNHGRWVSPFRPL